MQTKIGSRRQHSDELKADVLKACDQPGASVAAIALQHGLNANLVHRWRRLAGRRADSSPVPGTRSAGEFIALPLSVPVAAQAAPDIHIELRRGATVVNLAWPLQAAGDCAQWLRELLR
jgi:transposase